MIFLYKDLALKRLEKSFKYGKIIIGNEVAMIKKLDIEKLMNWLFLITIFFMPVEMAMTMRIGNYLSPYKISFILLVLVLLASMLSGKFGVYFKSFIRAFSHYKWAIISIILYFAFDLVSLAWTKDIGFSLKKYVSIFPMLILAFYACYYFYGPRVNASLRKERLRKLALTFGLIALFLSVLTWIVYFIFARTYYIMTLSLQSDYNQYVLPIIIGYVCGVYYINTMEEDWQKKLVFLAYSMILMPNFYLSGSRRIIVMYLLVFAALAIYFIVTSMAEKKTLGNLFICLAIIAMVLGSHQVIIKGFNAYSKYVYDTMEEDAMKKGINPPSAQADKSDGIIHGFRLENDADYKEKTLESGDALGRRKTIWTIAFNEIKSFNKKELLIGRGGSNQRDIYRTEEAREMLFPQGKITDTGSDFHPHSMLLVEMVNGGLIKTGITLSIVLSMIYYAIKIALKKKFHEFIMVAGFGAILLSSQMIDSIYGLLENRMTWIFFFIVLGSLGQLKNSYYEYKK